MAILHPVAKGAQPKSQSSAKTFMPVGSGSRPTKSGVKIMTSAPDNAYKLDGRGKGHSPLKG
jgi:hypothetical protein